MAEDTQKIRLLRRMKITRSNRFNCAKRLERQMEVQGWVINLISLFTVAAGVAVLVNDGLVTALGDGEEARLSNEVAGVIVIGLSVLGLVIGLTSPAKRTAQRSMESHQCGREVSHVYRRLAIDEISVAEASAEYENVISRFSDNHDPCDYYETIWKYGDEMKDQQPKSNWFLGSVFPLLSICSPIFQFGIGAAVLALVWVSLLP